jgi:hypothetical protein
VRLRRKLQFTYQYQGGLLIPLQLWVFKVLCWVLPYRTTTPRTNEEPLTCFLPHVRHRWQKALRQESVTLTFNWHKFLRI